MKAIVFIHDDQPDRNGDMVDIDGLSFPGRVSVRNDVTGEPIGMAALKREGDRIVADLPDGLSSMLVPCIGYRVIESIAERKKGIDGTVLHITKAELLEISLGQANADDRIPALGGPTAVRGKG